MANCHHTWTVVSGDRGPQPDHDHTWLPKGLEWGVDRLQLCRCEYSPDLAAPPPVNRSLWTLCPCLGVFVCVCITYGCVCVCERVCECTCVCVGVHTPACVCVGVCVCSLVLNIWNSPHFVVLCVNLAVCLCAERVGRAPGGGVWSPEGQHCVRTLPHGRRGR